MVFLINNPIINIVKEKVGREHRFYIAAKKAYTEICHVFSPMGGLRNYVIFPVKAFFRTHKIRPFYDNHAVFIERQRDRYKGRRCFVIATGPSLKIKDLERLKEEVTIGVNTIFRAYNQTDFRPTYYMALDPDMQKIYDSEGIGDVSGFAVKGVFLNPQMKRRYRGTHLMYVCHQNHWYNVGDPYFDLAKNLKWTDNPVWGIYDKYTITSAAIDWAVYLGCKEIYLIGADCTYSGKWHFDETKYEKKMKKQLGQKDYAREAPKDRKQKPQIDRSHQAAYRFLERESRKRGIRIYNATRGGMLEEFERVDFDQLMDETP